MTKTADFSSDLCAAFPCMIKMRSCRSIYVGISKTQTAQYTQKKRKLDCVSVPMSTHHVYSREELNEFRLKREVYSMFLLTLCLHELVGTVVDNNFSRIVLLMLFADVLFVEPLM